VVQDAKLALQQRLSRLRQELLDEVGLELSDDALDEMAYCRYVEPHEGRRPSYGAVVWTAPLPASFAGVPQLPSPAGFVDSGAPLEVLRTFADGRTSFIIRGPGITPAVAIDPAWVGTEMALAAHASGAEVTIVQRLASGRIRLYVNEQVYSEEGGVWLTRPTALAYYEQVALILRPEHYASARAILDMCVHTLSPAGHGATLVWFPEGAMDIVSYLDMSVAITSPQLSTASPAHAASIAHALGQFDRAALLESSGRLMHLNVSLGHADHIDDVFSGGTRHNSAGRYSAEYFM
jgi:hypothetical protein